MAGASQPPVNAFGPYKPSADRPFDDRRVCHLLRRAGFGKRPDRLDRLHGQTPEAALDWLFNISPDDDPLNDKLHAKGID